MVLDNFITHRNPNFIARIQAADGDVLHLPPYSPDLNPVRHPIDICRSFPSVFVFSGFRARD